MLRWIARGLRRIVVVLLAMIGAAGVIVGGLALLAIYVIPVPGMDRGALPASMVLTLTLDDKLGSSAGGGALDRLFGGGRIGLEDALAALAGAETDGRIKGVFLDLSRAHPGLAEAQELRAAVARLRAAGKTVTAFADSFGEGASGGPAYYVASSAQQVWLQPSGDWSWTGASLEGVFLKDTLAKLGIAPDMIQRHEYKGAMEPLTRSEFSAPVRENLGRAVQGWFAQMLRGAAEGRTLTEAEIRAQVARAPLSAEEAQTARLVDRLGYRHDALEAAGVRKGGTEAVSLERYFQREGSPWKGGPVIAVIHGDGEITRSSGRGEGALRAPEFTADRVGRALAKAADDPDVAAIILRIDSPGGSYVASDAIHAQVLRARQSKPVIASLKDVAASGGYFVALAADRILASPGTLTGSIGVVGGKIVVAELMKTLGVSTDPIEVGEHAGMWTPSRPFTADERRRVEAMMDRVYADFTGKVADARKLSPEEVDRLARGRVWTGEDALAGKLVDAEGGFLAAIAAAKQAAKLAPDAKVTVEAYPAPKSTWDLLTDTAFSGDLPDDVGTFFAGLRWLARLGGLVPQPGIQLR